MSATKRCRVCRELKPFEAFYKHPTARDGRQGTCRPCVHVYRRNRRATVPAVRAAHRASKTLQRYGLTPAGLAELVQQQSGLCPICRRDLEAVARTHIDHCHDTGRVRGVLCSECNTGIGKLKDDPTVLRRAVAYLEK